MTTTYLPTDLDPFGDLARAFDPTDPEPRLLRRGELLARGFTDNHIRRARSERSVIVLGPGIYLFSTDWREQDDLGRYRLLLRAVTAGLAGDPVVSHRSAAIVHGVIPPPAGPEAVHIIRNGPAKSRQGPMIRAHRGVLGADQIVRCDRLAVTSVARTVVDFVLTQPAGPASAVLRRVFADGLLTPADLWAQVRRQERTPGTRSVAALVTAVLDEQPGSGDPPGGPDDLDPGSQPATVIRTASGVPVADSQS